VLGQLRGGLDPMYGNLLLFDDTGKRAEVAERLYLGDPGRDEASLRDNFLTIPQLFQFKTSISTYRSSPP
jgi:hypothetical protein